MDSEFINIFISKQKKYIDELTAKNILLDTQLEVSSSLATKLKEEKQALELELEKLKKKNKNIEQ